MRGRLSTKLALAMAVVAVVAAALALPAAIVYTEHRLAGLPEPARNDAMDRIELNSWDDLDGLAEWGVVSLVSGIVAVGIGWALARRLTRPLRTISDAAHQIAVGNLEARTRLDRRDELGRLAADFDAMADDLQRLEDERRTAAAATAHELRTPVTIVRARLQAARDGLLQLDEQEISVLTRQLDGLTRIIEDLRILSLETAGRLTLLIERLDLREVISTQVDALTPTAADRDVRLTFEPGPEVIVEGDPDRLAQVITNLALNAIRHSPPLGEVRISCGLRGDAAGARSLGEITVADTGPGFPADIGDPFEPFATGTAGADLRPGSGLGLTIAKAIVGAHGGDIRAANGGPGATVTITLPTVGSAK